MSDIPSSLAKIQIEGTQFRRPVSEALQQALGAAINGLIDDKYNVQDPTFVSIAAQIAVINSRLDDHDTQLLSHFGRLNGHDTDIAALQALIAGKIQRIARTSGMGPGIKNVTISTVDQQIFSGAFIVRPSNENDFLINGFIQATISGEGVLYRTDWPSAGGGLRPNLWYPVNMDENSSLTINTDGNGDKEVILVGAYFNNTVDT